MREKDLQDFLYENPELLFPGKQVQERAREYSIQGKRVDLLFMVDGIRYIVELKAIPLEREHIGQVVEYYGLMKRYFHEANLRMILVAPSIPHGRGEYLEELGIRCVELAEVPQASDDLEPVLRRSRIRMREETDLMERDSLLIPNERLEWDEAVGLSTRRTCAFARRFLRDSLEQVRAIYSEYEITPYRIDRADSSAFWIENHEDSGRSALCFSGSSLWWAYSIRRFENAPPNEIPNIPVWTSARGIEVQVDAEIQSAQRVIQDRINSNPRQFNQIIEEITDLTLQMYLKFEHQPRFYFWVSCVRKAPGEFDAATVLGEYLNHRKRFQDERDYWIGRIIDEKTDLSEGRKKQLLRCNKSLNLATCLSLQFFQQHRFWELPYKGQVQELIDAVIRLKPVLEFFIQ